MTHRTSRRWSGSRYRNLWLIIMSHYMARRITEESCACMTSFITQSRMTHLRWVIFVDKLLSFQYQKSYFERNKSEQSELWRHQLWLIPYSWWVIPVLERLRWIFQRRYKVLFWDNLRIWRCILLSKLLRPNPTPMTSLWLIKILVNMNHTCLTLVSLIP